MTAARQLNWFQAEVEKRGLANMFTLPESRRALVHFVSINIELLRNLKYRELNQKAISKILKSELSLPMPVQVLIDLSEFDKRTQLGGASKAFPKLIQSAPIMSESIAKDLCAQINQDIVKIVPQLDDYSCPICSDIVWRPVKLKCEHVLVIRPSLCSSSSLPFYFTMFRFPMKFHHFPEDDIIQNIG